MRLATVSFLSGVVPARVSAGVIITAAGLALAACSNGPFGDDRAESLRQIVLDATQRELGGTDSAIAAPRELPRAAETDLGFSDAQLDELEAMAGPASYEGAQPPLGPSLLLEEDGPRVARLALEDAIAASVRNNLDVLSATVQPAIDQSLRTVAEARFDWVFFTGVDWVIQDQPSTVPVINGLPVGSAVTQSETITWETGVRRDLRSGGLFQARTELAHTDFDSPGIAFSPDPANTAIVELLLQQPLLRGFGRDVTLAEVRLAENQERRSVEDLRAQLFATVRDTEQAYWDLHNAYGALQVRERLLERGIQTRDQLAGRLDFDVRPAEFSDARARVESRRADVIEAQAQVRRLSDRLKALLNDPRFPVGDETVLLPIGAPPATPIEFSLLDMTTTAIERRPELQRALLNIDDTAIRQRVAENGLLPLLDLQARARGYGLDDSPGGAYREVADQDYLDFLLGVDFEIPFGNRAAEANFARRRLERMQAVVQYRAALQSTVLAVKDALRDVATNFQLIGQRSVARLAAAENLRTLQVEEETLRGLTPDFLNLKLNRQEALAQAELAELQAAVNYATAIAALYDAMGVALDRWGVSIEVPTPEQLLPGEYDEFGVPPNPTPPVRGGATQSGR